MSITKSLIKHINMHFKKIPFIFAKREFHFETYGFKLLRKVKSSCGLEHKPSQLYVSGEPLEWFKAKLDIHVHQLLKSKNLLLKSIKLMSNSEKKKFLHYFKEKQMEDRLETL